MTTIEAAILTALSERPVRARLMADAIDLMSTDERWTALEAVRACVRRVKVFGEYWDAISDDARQIVYQEVNRKAREGHGQ